MKRVLILTFAALSMIACSKQQSVKTTYQVPAFDQMNIDTYLPTFEAAIAENKAEIDAIVSNPEAPTFENTLVALDRSGMRLDSISAIFFNVLEADGNDQMDALAEQIQPMLSELSDGIILNEGLFQRVKAVYDQREELGLNAEDMRLLTETYKRFDQNGANLPEADKERLKEINQELAMLSLKFGQNVVNETNSIQIFVTDENELKGLPESAKSAAKEEATAAGRPEAWLFTPKRTSFTPVLQYCENRALREQLQPGEYGVFLETAHPAKFKEKVDAITGGDVEIPARLQAFMKGTKQSVEISKDYADFRNFLFNESK